MRCAPVMLQNEVIHNERGMQFCRADRLAETVDFVLALVLRPHSSLLDDRFARPVSNPAGEQTGQNVDIKYKGKKRKTSRGH